MNQQLKLSLKKLRLSGIMGSIEMRLHEAMANQLSHAEFLGLILSDELAVREEGHCRGGLRQRSFGN